MPFTGYQIQRRDIQQQTQERFDTKLDDRRQIRAVITDSAGSDTGSMVWADEPTRQVWIREVGTSAPSRCYCYYVTPDKLGLPVIVGYDIGSNIRQVLRSDIDFIAPSNTDGRSYESIGLGDIQAGGRFNLWIESKMIQPLSTYPDETGLTVNVVGGDYPYIGERKTFAGQTGIDLVQNPNPGEHYFAGLYLDSANTLNVIYGASIAVASDPPEPAWPTGAFLLSVVRINDTQTSIFMRPSNDPDNDIFDRRLVFSDENAGTSWPFLDVLTVDATDPSADYTTITLALAAATGTQRITLGTNIVETVTLNKTNPLVGYSESVQISGTAATVLSISASGAQVERLTVRNTSAIATRYAIKTVASCVCRNVKVFGQDTGATTSYGFHASNSSTMQLLTCEVDMTSGGSYGTGIYGTGSGTVIEVSAGTRISAGSLGVAVEAASSASVKLNGPLIVSGSVVGSGVTGYYLNNNGNIVDLNLTASRVVTTDASKLLASSAVTTTELGYLSGVTSAIQTQIDTKLDKATTGAWLIASGGTITKEASLAAAITAAATTGDNIELFPGTQTGAQTVGKSTTIFGNGPNETILTLAINSSVTVTISTTGVTLRNLTINHTGGGTGGICLANDQNGFVIENCYLNHTSGAGTASACFNIIGGTGSGTIINNCVGVCTSGSSAYGLNVGAAANVLVIGGSLNGTTADIICAPGAVVELRGVKLVNGTIDTTLGGTVKGWWIDTNDIRHDLVPAGLVMNGALYHWQEGTSFAAAANGVNTADGFVYNKIGVGVHTVARDASIPTAAQAFNQSPFSILVDCTTIDATIAAGDLYAIGVRVLGYDFARVAGQTFSFPFWVSATKAGVYCVAFRNSGADRSFVQEMTLVGSDTWEQKYITVAPSPSGGTWDYTNGTGLNITWSLAVGSTFQTTAGTWQTGNFLGTANQVNAVDNTANNFRLALVCNPSLDEEQEFKRCQTRHWKTYDRGVAPGTNTATGLVVYQTRTAIAGSVAGTLRYGTRWPSMRATPTVTVYSSDGTANAVRNATAANNRTGSTAQLTGDSGMPQIAVDNTSANAIALDDIILFHLSAKAQL